MFAPTVGCGLVGARCARIELHEFALNDPDLARIAVVWIKLSDAQKRAIRPIVDSVLP